MVDSYRLFFTKQFLIFVNFFCHLSNSNIFGWVVWEERIFSKLQQKCQKTTLQKIHTKGLSQKMLEFLGQQILWQSLSIIILILSKNKRYYWVSHVWLRLPLRFNLIGFELSIVLGVSSHVQKYCAFHKNQKIVQEITKNIFSNVMNLGRFWRK